MPKFISGRSKKTPISQLRDDRYRYLSVGEAEPDLGDPLVGPSSIGAKPVAAGQQYIVVSVQGQPGERYWIPNQGGLIPGSISVFEEGFLVGGASSTTQLNFIGNSVTATGVGGVSPGIGVTITIVPPGNDNEVLFKDSGDFSTDTRFTFDNGFLAAGDRITVGTGGTVITTTGIGSVGIGTTNPLSKLHVQGDLKLTGTIVDRNGDPGQEGYILVKETDALGGLSWIAPENVTFSGGGEYQQIQYKGSAGLVEGADLFYYDETFNRVGIGSTQPTQRLDVLGISTFKGGVFIDNLSVSGFSTFTQLIDANGGLDVFGHSELDNINVSGLSTFTGNIDANGNLDVDGQTDLDVLNVSDTASFTSTTDNTLGNANTGAVQIDGGVGVNKNLTVGQSIQAVNLNITGIGTISQFDFGSGLFDNITVTGISTLGNIKIDGGTIYTNSGTLTLDSAGNSVQIAASDRLVVNNTTQSTTKDTGAFVVEGGVGIEKDLYVGGNLDVNSATFRGNVDLGDDASDTVTFTAVVDSNIIPSGTVNLGSPTNKWNIVYANTISGNSDTANYATRAGLATDLEINATNRLLYQVSNNNTDVLPAGTANYLLQSNGTSAPSWVSPTGLTVDKASYADNAGIATNLKGGSASQIPYQSSANTTAFIPNGTSGQLLQSNGTLAPSWTSPGDISAGIAETANNLSGGAAGSIPYQTALDTTTFLAEPNVDGYVLTYNNTSNAPQWSDLTTLSGAGYTFFAVDSGDNVILRLSDGGTNNDVTITAGSNVTIDPVASGGFTISATGAGVNFAGLTVYEESSSVGTAFTALKFIGNSITATDGGSGIANITVSIDYGDISNPPTIPTDVSDLTDSGGIIPTDVSQLTDNTNIIPTDVSDLTDSGGIIPTDTGDLSNNVGFITGITVKDENGTVVGTAGSITTLDFNGSSGVVFNSPSSDTASITISTSGGGSGNPAGTVIYSASSTVPDGYIKANGASLNTTTYADLFAAIGYTYGGSGSSFNAPDLRGEFIRGWDDSRGIDSGRGFGSFQNFQLAQHNHGVSNGTNQVRWTGGSSGFPNLGPGTPQSYNLSFVTVSTNNEGGTSNSSESRPRNVALLACIKY